MLSNPEDSAEIRYHMISTQLPHPIVKLNNKKRVKDLFPLPSNETARLLILKQTKIIHSSRKELEYDRFASLAKRILEVPCVLISFIDVANQWIKSNIGLNIANVSIPREHSLDAMLMFPDSAEILPIINLSDPLHQGKYSAHQTAYNLPDGKQVQYYVGAAIIVDGFRIGALSVIDTEPREHLSLDYRQNLVDLAAAISNIVKERRQRYLRFKKERANLMLGLNHNLRTPLMSLTVVTEMLRSEVKALAVSKDYLSIRSNAISRSEQRSIQQDQLLETFISPNNSSKTNSKSASRHNTPDVPCMHLFGDLYGSLQQLGLLVEMGLILGKITSGLSVLSDGTYESILCNLLKTYDKVQSMTQRIGQTQNVIWSIDRSKLLRGKHYSHPDVLMFVLISCLTQLIPHSDLIKVKGSFVSIEEVHRFVEDETATAVVASIVDVVSPAVVVGNVGILLTEVEAFGDSANLKEIVERLHQSNGDNQSTSGTSSENSDANNMSPDEAEEFIHADVEEFGGSIFALGNLLENVLGGSSYLITDSGCVFSFSIPCRVEIDPNDLLFENEHDFKEESLSMKAKSTLLERVEEEEAEENSHSNRTSESAEKDLQKSEIISESDGEGKSMNGKGLAKSHYVSFSEVAIYTKEVIVRPDLQSNNNNDNNYYYADIPIISTARIPNEDQHALSMIENRSKSTSTENTFKFLNSEGLTRSSRSLQILLVDDSITVQKTLAFWFKKHHCTITRALNGAMALDLMKETTYDLIFIDFLMPVMDGLTCIREFREYGQTLEPTMLESLNLKDQWIIGMSATALQEDQDAAFAVGMNMFCSKPMDMNALTLILEAKRLGISYDILARLATHNRDSKMTDYQKDLAVELILPLPPDDSPTATTKQKQNDPSSIAGTESHHSEKLSRDRSELKESFNQEIGGRVNIFGGFRFNTTEST